MKLRNPIGNKVSLGNGYSYQSITLRGGKYVKLWHHGEVIDRALSVASVKAMARRYAQRELALT